jgi:hypothetical protein
MVGGRVRMPNGVRDGGLLRQREKQGANEVREPAFFHTGWQSQLPDSMRFKARRAQDGEL